jgi:predicted metalloprotease with PDZ domain
MKIIVSFAISFFLIAPTFSQKIHYTVSFPNAAHHEAKIMMNISGVKSSVLTVRMSRSSPGRYATHEFGKNVYDVSATDPSGKTLSLKRIEGDVYEVSGVKGNATITYTLFGNYADGTYAGIDPTSIHLNMPAAFMWAKGYETAPIEVDFVLPDPTFTIATQLKPGKNKTNFSAPNLQYFLDSPTKIGKLHWREWNVTTNGKQQTIRIALEAKASDAGVDSLATVVKRIADQSAKVFGTYPNYDYGTYTFLASINPYVKGDGMEHRNSTMITLPMEFTTDPDELEVFAHEFFHCWNVERIRPKTLEPFNFEKSNMSNELWCAEGFTQYYGQLLMVRAGTVPDTSFARSANGFINAKANSPGGTMYSPIQSSNLAVFTDAGRSIDVNNFSNIFTSYYIYGASVALALDLSLRGQFNSSLDAFMQQMWKQHGKPEIPYTVADMEKALAVISNASFAKDFFSKYVYGKQIPDYRSLLAPAGMELRQASRGKAWIGNLSRAPEKNGIVISSHTARNTPLYNAGLDIDDVITSLAGQTVTTVADLNRILATHAPGEQVKIGFTHRGVEQTSTIQLKENPSFSVVTYESAGKLVTQSMLNFRRDWLGMK